MKSRHSETGGDFFMLKKVMADKLWREVRQALPDGAVYAGRVLRGLGERGSPQCCNPVNAAHSPDWRHSPHHREEAGVCR